MTTSTKGDGQPSKIITYVVLLLCSLLIFTCCKRNVNPYSAGDSYGTLLVSESLLKHGSIKLDRYQDRLAGDPRFGQKSGHLYNYFPIGTPIMAMPLTAIALAAGKDTLNDNRRLQEKMAGVVNIAIFLFLFLLARRFLSDLPAALLAGGFWISTSLSSVLATALWSHDFAVLFALISLWLTTKPEATTIKTALLVGLVLFLGYLCRPTLSLLAAATVLFFLMQRMAAQAAAISASFALCMLVFIAFSWQEFGQLLPDYYMPQRLESNTFATALYGNMLSPARGFLIYTPILIALLLRPSATIEAARRHAGLWLAMLFWIIVHWISISRFQHWWAGYSYGPRLMVDIMPGLFVLIVTTISCWQIQSRYDFVRPALVLLILIGGWMHVIQGTRNSYSGALWNGKPNIDENPQLIFDWRYPQFLHNQERHEKRLREAGNSPTR